MAETVRVRCAVGRRDDGYYVILGSEWWLSGEARDEVEYWDGVEFVQWVTVEIPVPVEPVVVAEVEDGDER